MNYSSVTLRYVAPSSSIFMTRKPPTLEDCTAAIEMDVIPAIYDGTSVKVTTYMYGVGRLCQRVEYAVKHFDT